MYRTTVAPVRSLTASRAPRIRAAHASSPLSTAAATRGTSVYANAYLSWRSLMQREALTHQRDRLIGVPAPHRQDGANIQRPASGTTDRPVEALAWPHRAGVPLGQCRRSQERLTPSRSAHSRCPTGSPATGTLQQLRVNQSRAAVRLPSACSTRAGQILGLHDHIHVAGVVGEHGTRSSPARARSSSPCVYHSTAAPSSALDSAAGGRDGRSRICSIPPEAFGRIPPNQPEELQAPRDVGRFGGTAALDEPPQGAAIILEIVTHAIQPFGLRKSTNPAARSKSCRGAAASNISRLSRSIRSARSPPRNAQASAIAALLWAFRRLLPKARPRQGPGQRFSVIAQAGIAWLLRPGGRLRVQVRMGNTF